MSSGYNVRKFIERFPLPDHQDVLTKFEVPEYGHMRKDLRRIFLLQRVGRTTSIWRVLKDVLSIKAIFPSSARLG
jgi:hypothetical protein